MFCLYENYLSFFSIISHVVVGGLLDIANYSPLMFYLLATVRLSYKNKIFLMGYPYELT